MKTWRNYKAGNHFPSAWLDSIPAGEIFFFVIRNYEVVFWNTNEVSPSDAGSPVDNEMRMIRTPNGLYASFSTTKDSLRFVGFFPVLRFFSVNNEYLTTSVNPKLTLSSHTEISEVSMPGSVVVNDSNGIPLFYIVHHDEEYHEANLFAVSLFFLGLILLLSCLDTWCGIIPLRWHWLRWLFLGGAFWMLLAFLIHDSNLPDGLSHWNIFDPNIYASAGLADSLGSLFLICMSLLGLAIIIYRKIPLGKWNKIWRYPLSFFSLSILFAVCTLIVAVIMSLVADSSIVLDVFNPNNPDVPSIIAMSCAVMLAVGFFFLVQKVIQTISQSGIPFLHFVLLALGGSASVYFVARFSVPGFSWIWIAVWVLSFLIIFFYSLKLNLRITRFLELFASMVIMAASIAVLFNFYGIEKEKNFRLAYAHKLVYERDNLTEYLFTEMQRQLPRDAMLADYFISKNIRRSALVDHLLRSYFRGSFNRYTITFLTFDEKGNPYKNKSEGSLSEFENKLQLDCQDVMSDFLYFYSDPGGTYNYVAKTPIIRQQRLVGTLVIEFRSKIFAQANVYPELLLETKDKLPAGTNRYSYAVYKSNRLVNHSGPFDYVYENAYDQIVDSLKTESYSFSAGEFNHLIYHPSETYTVIVSRKNPGFSEFISYFSFVFAVLFALVISLVGFHSVRKIFISKPFRNPFNHAPLRNIIQFNFVLVIVSAVVFIGVITGIFFEKQFKQNSYENLQEKLEAFDESLNYMMVHPQAGMKLSEIINQAATNVSDIEDVDVNFYDLKGQLITSSQSSIFERGLISNYMNPAAFAKLNSGGLDRVLLNETIGKLSYLSAYSTVHESTGSPLMYINIPYFNTRKYMDEELGFFYAALLNIAVFALIIGGILAPFISNRIISKLSQIGQRFREVNLGRKNEPIEWHSNDEVGTLVKEFNKMILKLEKSAGQLAQSERESAWREMAKQVAHEIKNPLTPMKLSIQHLQRAQNESGERAKEIAERVSQTLLEQIDNLARIANEFSTFAKMPAAENRSFDVHEVLRNTVDLYKENEEIHISFQPGAQQSLVFADRGQLLRVFNNLALNGIQAITEERAGIIQVSTANEGNTIVISVKDNGRGIREVDRENVFVPNFTTKNSGMGLGLAMAKNIVEFAGGTIWFESGAGVTTTFFVRLPLTSDALQKS